MVKNYFYIFFIALLLASFNLSAQTGKKKSQEVATIEGFSFYPNPVTNGKIYITTKADKSKEIEIFDVLGYVVLQTVLNEKELSVSNLSPGVYIIKVKEGDATVTRKLIIK